MFKRIKKHIIWIVLGLYLVISLSFISKGFDKILCERVNIIIQDSTRLKFVQPDDVVDLFKTMDAKIWGYNAFDISTYEIEQMIFKNIPLVKDASVWAGVDGVLNIEIDQREPIVRVVTKTNQSYYIDKDAYLLPVSSDFTARVLVASGDIYHKFAGNIAVHIDSALGLDGNQGCMIDEIYALSDYLYHDDILSKQIEQIYVTKEEFELYPKIGTHSILFGTVDNLEDKFFKLKVIYYKGFSNLGWNKYRQINLKYKNQVVCTKR